MTTRHALKIVQHGQTQQQKTVQAGSGLHGQALVVKATADTRYQLTDIVSQTSPAKLQVKRVGNDLHLALPGGDVQAPDIVLQDYFSVSNASLWGVSSAGEWMSYDSSALQTAQQTTASAAPQTLALATPSQGWLSTFDSPWGLAGVVGGVAVLAAAGGGGGASSSPEATPSAETILKNHATDDASNTDPTLANYTSYGIKAYASLTDTHNDNRVALSASNTNLSAINSALVKLGSANITQEKVQAAVNAYYRILKEADGSTSVDVDVYADTTYDAVNAATYDDPTAADYAAIGATAGATTQALALLNDVVGRVNASAVDSVNEINALARAAENVMLQAQAATSAATGGPSLYTTDAEWLTGLALIGVQGVTTSALLADAKAAIAATADDGSAVNTVEKLKAVIAPVLAFQTLKDFTNDSAAIGSKTAATPTLNTYKDLGVQAWTSLTDNTRVALDDAAVGGLLNATTLNSYLDAQAGGALSKDSVQDLADALYRILKEADGSTATDLDVYPQDGTQEDPSAADYAAVGVTVTDVSTGTASTNETLNLLNDAVGRAASGAVDSHSELQALQATAQDVMRLASGQSAQQTDANLLAGLKNLSGLSTLNSTQLDLVKAAIAATADDGSAVDSVTELQGVMQKAMALQTLKNYSVSNSNTTPTLADYQNAGLKAFDNLSTENPGTDIGSGSAAFLTANILNTALDARDDLSSLTTASDIQTALQTLVNAYYRILSEADASVNTSTNTDVYPNDTAQHEPLRGDYAAIGATVGSDAALALLNDHVGLSSDAAVDSVAKLNALAQAAENAMVQAGVAAGSSTPPASYSTDAQWIAGLNLLLGLNTSTGVNSNNVTTVKTALAAVSDASASTDIDTVQELKDLLTPAFALQQLKDYTNANGVGVTVPDMALSTQAGIKTFKSLSDTSDASRKALGDASTASGAESNTFLTASTLNSALDRLDGATLSTSQVQTMADAYYRVLREADGNSATDTDVYNDTTHDNARATALNDPTLADYEALGITVADAVSTSTYSATTGVGNESLDLLNDAIGRLGTSAVDTVAEILTLATTANDVMLLTGGQTASQSDVQLIGGLNALLGLNTGTGVNSDNLTAVKTTLTGKNDNGSETDTVAELLGVLGLARLVAFTDDGAAIGSKTAATPTLADWSAIGLTANTSLADDTRIPLASATYWSSTNPGNGLAALNSALDALPGTSVNSARLQTVVNAYGRILQEADGAWTTATDVSKVATGSAADLVKQDLLDVGVSAFYSDDSAALLASAIGNLVSASVDSLGELNTLAVVADNVLKQAAGGAGVSYSSDAEWVSALNSLLRLSTGNGATSSNIGAIKTAIDNADAAGVDSYQELQAIVSRQRLHDYANSGTGSPQLLDYQAVHAAENSDSYAAVKTSGIAAYNSAVLADTGITSGEITDIVAQYNKVLDAADGNRASTAPGMAVGDYTRLGVTVTGYSTIAASQTLVLLNDTVSGLTLDGVDSAGELQALEDIIGKIMTMAANPKITGAGAGDYTALVTQSELGLLGLKANASDLASSSHVTDAEALKFNELVIYSADDGSGVNSIDKLQGLLSSAIVLA